MKKDIAKAACAGVMSGSVLSLIGLGIGEIVKYSVRSQSLPNKIITYTIGAIGAGTIGFLIGPKLDKALEEKMELF